MIQAVTIMSNHAAFSHFGWESKRFWRRLFSRYQHDKLKIRRVGTVKGFQNNDALTSPANKEARDLVMPVVGHGKPVSAIKRLGAVSPLESQTTFHTSQKTKRPIARLFKAKNR